MSSNENVSSLDRFDNWFRSAAARVASARWPVAVAGLLLLAAATWWVTNSALFDLRTIRVEGNDHLSKRQVVRLGGLRGDVNVLWTFPGDIERRLERHPWIKEAHVSRILPGALSVTVVERRPLAVLPGSRTIIAPDGRVLGKEQRTTTLPVVSAEQSGPEGSPATGSADALVVARTLPRPVRQIVEEVTIGSGGLIELQMRDGTRVIFGNRSDLRLKSAVLRAMLEWTAKNDIVPGTVDISVPTAPTLVPGAAQQQSP